MRLFLMSISLYSFYSKVFKGNKQKNIFIYKFVCLINFDALIRVKSLFAWKLKLNLGISCMRVGQVVG